MAVSSPETDEFADLGTPVDEFADLGTPVIQKDQFADLGTPVEVVQQEAMKASLGAIQALDVMGAPGRLDWSEVNEKLDQERFAQVLALNDQAAQLEARDPNQMWDTRSEAAKLRTQAFGIQQQMSPDTTAGRGAASLERQDRNLSAQAGMLDQVPRETFQSPVGQRDGRTPSEMLSGLLGPGLSPTVMPVAEGAARNVGPAAAGAIAAARFIPHPGAQAVAAIGMPIVASVMGSQVGSAGQEALLQSTETPEETQQRQQRGAEDFARNPGLSRIGASVAGSPWFGPGLAQFGRAAAGDRGAILNLGLAGGLGGSMEVLNATLQGRPVDAADVAAGVFSNLIMNEPTRLGRRLGLPPSSEQAAFEAAQKYNQIRPEPGRTSVADIITPAPDRVSIAETFPAIKKANDPEKIGPLFHAGAPNVVFQKGREAWFTDSPETLEVYLNTEHPLHWERRKGREKPEVTEANISGKLYSGSESDRKILIDSLVSKATAIPEDRGGFWVTIDGKKNYSNESSQELAIEQVANRTADQAFNRTEEGEIIGIGNKKALLDAGFEGAVTPVDYTPGAKNYVVFDPSQITKRETPLAEVAPEAPREVYPAAEARKVGPIIYDGVTQMGEDGFYNFSDTTSKPGTRISFTVESTSPPTAEQIAAKHAEALDRFGVKLPEPVEETPPPVEEETPPPAPPEPPVAARASEAPADLPGATSNKEAVVNAERAARELDPVIKEARISNAESIDRAQQVVAENPLKPQEIIARLRENPQERTISLEDSAVLLVERTKLSNQRRELADRALDETLTPEERATAKAEFDVVEGRLNDLDQAAQDARSTWGRFGQLWQRAMREDFSLEALTRKARVKKGEPLTPEESAQIKKVADDVETAQKAADEAVAAAEIEQVGKAVDETIKSSAAQQDAEPAVRSLADRIIAKLDLRAEAARARLREKFKRTSAGVDPTILADFVDLAVSTISKSAIKSGQWISNMVKEWGEEARPYLQAAWDKADAQLDKVVESTTSDKKARTKAKAKILSAPEKQAKISAAIAERVKEGESIDSLGRYVDKLVDSFVAGGIRDRDALVASVKEVLEPLAPGITDRKVGELISGYGQSTKLSKDPLKVIKRDLKGQLQQVSKLKALAAKEPLKKTGPERRTASDEERRLIKEVNAAKKEAGVTTTDPETQLKSTLDSARTRFSNEIKDLTFEIETGERPPTKTPVEYTQEIEVLRGLRDRLKETVRLLEGPRELTHEQRVKLTTRALQDSIAAIEKRIAGEQPKTRRAAPDTPEIRALKAKRDALRADLNEMNAADSLLQENRKAESLVRSIEQAEAELAGRAARPGAQQGPESQLVSEARQQLAAVREQLKAKRDADPIVQREKMDAAEAAVEKAIKKLDEQLKAGDISVQRAPTPAGTQRLEDLRMQRDAMNQLRNQLRREARPKANPLDVAIKAREGQLKRQEADYLDRIARKDFGPRTRKPPVDLSSSPKALDALARVQTAKDQFTKLQKEWELKNRTRTEKILGGIKQGWDAIRNLKLSMDLSAPLQTAFAMAAHPIEGAKAVGKGARAFAEQLFRNSDTYAKRVEQEIVNSPNNKNGLYKAMKLDLSEVTGANREENAGSVLERLADLESRWQDIPDFAKGLIGMKGQQLVSGAKGIAKALPKVVGLGIKASNAGFGAIANHMRARTADAMLARWYRRRGAPTKQQLELLGNQINAATGKGGLRGEEGLRSLLFAPNYYLSILKQLSFQPAIKAGIKHEGAAAREILEEYVRAAATMSSIATLQYLFGNREKQTLDPRSPNFGRAMTDKGTSLDFTMGRGAYATLASQIATGERINRQGRVEKQDPSSAFLTFLKGRLSREISAGLTTAHGKDFRGKPLDAAGLAKDLVAPLSWQDVDDVLKREGLTRGTFIQMLNMLGVTHRLAD